MCNAGTFGGQVPCDSPPLVLTLSHACNTVTTPHTSLSSSTQFSAKHCQKQRGMLCCETVEGALFVAVSLSPYSGWLFTRSVLQGVVYILLQVLALSVLCRLQ